MNEIRNYIIEYNLDELKIPKHPKTARWAINYMKTMGVKKAKVGDKLYKKIRKGTYKAFSPKSKLKRAISTAGEVLNTLNII